MNKHQSIAAFFLRISLAAGFFSAVSSRINFLTGKPDSWAKFLKYAEDVNSFAPPPAVPWLATMATILEISFALLLLIGYKIKWVAKGASVLTLCFALAMAYSFGIREPLDYSVFAFSAGAFLLSTMPENKWSIDSLSKQILHHS
ncbi:MAG: DoxX family protein [Bacteroidetes bacterium]|nr:DoxX family protein [Bacteroidota bacterium]MBS1670014.1 DoxX family protein [Bacteroidota bacterium]